MLMFHVSNRYMDVQSLISAAVTDASLEALFRHDEADDALLKAGAQFVIAAKNTGAFGSLAQDPNWLKVEKPDGITPWTDDYSNMLQILRWQ
jgi:hypothetical protein